MQVSAPIDEIALDHEISMISRALAEHGTLDRRELGRLVGARYWGPGRFSAALREAIAEGEAQAVSRHRIAPPLARSTQ
jgi:endo-1,4-beta-D-glucanase Y